MTCFAQKSADLCDPLLWTFNSWVGAMCTVFVRVVWIFRILKRAHVCQCASAKKHASWGRVWPQLQESTNGVFSSLLRTLNYTAALLTDFTSWPRKSTKTLQNPILQFLLYHANIDLSILLRKKAGLLGFSPISILGNAAKHIQKRYSCFLY